MSVEVRSPINENVDFTAGFSRGSADTGTVYNPYYDVFAKLEVTSTVFGGGITYQFLPGEQVNPYISAGLNWAKAEATLKVNGYSEEADDDEIGFNFGTGIEFLIGDSYTGPEMSVLAGLGYSSVGDDNLSLGVSFNVWAMQQVLISLGIDYGFDEGNRTIYGGIGIGF